MISQAVILCGGLGTRLGALTASTPKPLLPVGDRPFLEWLLLDMARQGVERVVLLAGFEASQIIDFAATTEAKARSGLEIEVAVESEPAGTGGALWQALDRLEPTFFMLNGDSWFDIDFIDIAARLARDPDALAALALRRLADAARYGSVGLDGERITSFAERPKEAGAALVSGGVYAMRRKIVEALTPKCSIERDVFPGLAERGLLRGYEYDGYFIDIGIPEDLARARREIPNRKS